MRRFLVRAGYTLAPVALSGIVAASTGPGRHRVAVLAVGVLLGIVLGVATAEREERAADPD
jgi:hypothetical protein